MSTPGSSVSEGAGRTMNRLLPSATFRAVTWIILPLRHRHNHENRKLDLAHVCMPTVYIYGLVPLLSCRYPCQNQGARSISASGHSTAAGRVRFNADGTALLSIGSDSRVVVQHLVLTPPPA